MKSDTYKTFCKVRLGAKVTCPTYIICLEVLSGRMTNIGLEGFKVWVSKL